MQNQPRTLSTHRLYWAGWATSGLAIAFLLMDASMKLLALPVVLQAQEALGFQGEGTARLLGAILLGCTLLYAAPPTAALGAHTREVLEELGLKGAGAEPVAPGAVDAP